MRADLPGSLDEISGLAFTADGRLFAHGDERAWIHEIDPATGTVSKRFMLGNRTARDDFEGIAIVGERFFLISSGGILYESREGEDREEVEFRVTDTGLASRCEVEGLEYHAAWDELLILCKTVSPDQGAIVIHRLPLDPAKQRPPPIQVDRSQLEQFGLGPDFHGSAIAHQASTRRLLMIAAREETMIEVTEEGRIVAGVQLSSQRHAQSEGLAIGRDGTLYIADEKNGRSARITMYYAQDRSGAR